MRAPPGSGIRGSSNGQLGERREKVVRQISPVRGCAAAALGYLLSVKVRSGESQVKMSQTVEIADKAIGCMQDTSKQILHLCRNKLQFGKSLKAMEVKELREALELIAELLDQDSLHCQAALDDAKQEDIPSDGAPSDLTWPGSSPDLHPMECLSLKDHIEQFWGVDYDSDAMPNFSD